MREQKRLKVITEVDAGRLTGRVATELLGLSLRQTRRVIAAYRKEGAARLAHGNRGKVSPRRIPDDMRERILELARKTYVDYNDCHFTEKLEEVHNIKISRSTARRLRRSIGQGSPRKRRPPRHRMRRERYPQSGMLLQIDGSPHPWLEERGPELCLLLAIDDATNEIPWALFRQEEDAAGYFQLLKQICLSHGLPQALYADRHTIFQSPKKATPEQQLAGESPRSQFGRLVDELGIELIPARSPQARGRVERLFGTLQDRLVKELREAGASTLEQANQVLRDYLPQLNTRFSVAPAQPGSCYCPWLAESDPEQFFCFKHKRVVGNDNTVPFDGHRLQIPPGPFPRSYARARVDVYQLLDGRLAVLYQGKTLVSFEPANQGPVRVGKFTPKPSALPLVLLSPVRPAKSKAPRKPYKPAPDHPWRRYPVAVESG